MAIGYDSVARSVFSSLGRCTQPVGLRLSGVGSSLFWGNGMNARVEQLQMGIDRWRARHAHLPWFRRYETLVLSLLALVAYALLLLPDEGQTSGREWPLVVGFFLGTSVWATIILGDREKPDWLKNFAGFGMVVTFGWLFYRYSGARWDKIGENFLSLEMMHGVWSMLWGGLAIALKVALVSAVLSMASGLFLGILRSLRNPVLELFVSAYVDIFRATPLIVLLLVVFYGVPFLGINLDPFPAAVGCLSLMYSAYISEVVRAGIESIHRSQVDASLALGMNSQQTMRLVVLPQALRVIIPPLTGTAVALLKDTAVASVVTLRELLWMANEAMKWKHNATPLMLSSVMYLIILLPLARFSSIMEARSKKWVRRQKR